MRLLATLCAALATLATAVPALAEPHDNGEGWAGETTDKLVTFFSLGVLLFIVVFITLATLAQSALERRKQEKKSAAAMYRRIGW